MTMAKSLRDTLEVWHLLVAITGQSVLAIIVAAVWVTNTDRDHVEFRAHDTAMQAQIERIDTEGSRVWAIRQPDENKSADKLDRRLLSIEDKFNTLDRQMTRLLVLSEQNQKLLKGAN